MKLVGAGKGSRRRKGENTKKFEDGHAGINWPSKKEAKKEKDDS